MSFKYKSCVCQLVEGILTKYFHPLQVSKDYAVHLKLIQNNIECIPYLKIKIFLKVLQNSGEQVYVIYMESGKQANVTLIPHFS